MTDAEKSIEQRILDGVTLLYKQNQQILTRIEAIEKSVGTVEPNHHNPLRGAKRPWEGGWSKDKVESKQTPNTADNTTIVEKTFNI